MVILDVFVRRDFGRQSLIDLAVKCWYGWSGMKLNSICNIVASRVLGEPGTLVQEVYLGRVYTKLLRVVGRGLSESLEIKDANGNTNYGFFNATRFKKAEVH